MTARAGRAIPSVPGYRATAEGQVLSKRTGRPLRPHPDKDGYLRLRLRRGGRYVNRHVHRLVAEAYLGPCPEGLICAHLDGDLLNNRPDNLTYCTQAENIGHKHLHGTVARGERIRASKLTEGEVQAIRTGYSGRRGEIVALGRRFGVSHPAIGKIIRRETWHHVQ